MKSFRRKESSTLPLVPATEDLEFKPFRETYKIITFTMIVGMLYPTPNTEKCRVVGIITILISTLPVCIAALLDMWNSWLRGDIINIIRHTTVIGPFLGAVFKMMLFFYSRKEAWSIIKKMDADHARYNTLSEQHKEIARRHIQDTQYYSEKCWSITVATCVLTFPLTAVILTFYNYAFKEDPVKYMVHDIDKPFSPKEDRFSSPYFEIMFFYMVYCSFFYIISFTGFDAFFGITINHACMKMELACRTMEDAMSECERDRRHRRMLGVIAEQNDLFRMVGLIQETFAIWLGLIVIATMLQICNCMYQIIEGYGIDPRYLIFILGTIAHIYLPCRYAAKLQGSALDVATHLYCCGWERVNDERARKMIVFMIARAQIPMKITAFNMFDFDMELFVSILQTSYSMFTLLKS
ncbi:odorant receptor Or2-like isoform X1 [Cydia splendana]|uniref:odorant receptor Or2-like isoform X1 n=2 Tax=Cydia splendana TaxID=1100963 RepID=UPI00213567B5